MRRVDCHAALLNVSMPVFQHMQPKFVRVNVCF